MEKCVLRICSDGGDDNKNDIFYDDLARAMMMTSHWWRRLRHELDGTNAKEVKCFVYTQSYYDTLGSYFQVPTWQ